VRWLKDHFKAAALVLIVLSGAGVIVAALLRSSPALWWILASIVFVVALVLLARFAPVFLLPLFYDIRPLARDDLRDRLLALAEQAGTPVLGAYEWRVGDRTTKANAALIGIGRTRRILVSDTLLAVHSDDEIETIFAHELAHHVYGDIWSALALEAALLTLGCYLADYVLSTFASAFGLDGKADIAGLPLLVLAAGAVSLLCAPLVNGLSRAHERRADRFALDATKNSTAFISAMRRLSAINLAEERPSRLVELLFHTHPSTAARIEAAKMWADRS
jgi:STE24 endopeptidase